MDTLDPATLATLSASASGLAAVLGAIAGILSSTRTPSDPWPRTWAQLDDDTRAWVAEQYAAVELPPPSMNRTIGCDAYAVAPRRPSPMEAERR